MFGQLLGSSTTFLESLEVTGWSLGSKTLKKQKLCAVTMRVAHIELQRSATALLV